MYLSGMVYWHLQNANIQYSALAGIAQEQRFHYMKPCHRLATSYCMSTSAQDMPSEGIAGMPLLIINRGPGLCVQTRTASVATPWEWSLSPRPSFLYVAQPACLPLYELADLLGGGLVSGVDLYSPCPSP